MPMWLHVVACVAVPAVWGVVMFYAFSAVDRRRTAARAEAGPEDPPPIDYSI